MLSALVLLTVLVAAGIWMLLHHLQPERDSTRRIIQRVDDILPQTQCQQCGYGGCLPYAQAIVSQNESLDLCPPGGQLVRRSLTELLGRSVVYQRRIEDSAPLVSQVVIDEAACIGCTKCIAACPVDAIVGAAKQMHTVIADQCTGCELCIAPCPVDCIETIDAAVVQWRWPAPQFLGPERRNLART